MIRNDLPALLQLFDFGDSLSVNGRRSTTNRALPQALFMMNSPLVLEAAYAYGRTVWQAAMCPMTNSCWTDSTYAFWGVRRARRNRTRRWRWSMQPCWSRWSQNRRTRLLGASPGVGVLSQALFCSTSFQYLD